MTARDWFTAATVAAVIAAFIVDYWLPIADQIPTAKLWRHRGHRM
ncbi:hypothetical protein ACFC18_28790 [Streptomyces sp. NPDC056121]